MARRPVDTIERRAQLVPQASPVDAYVRPAQPERSQLWSVAEGLAALDSDLSDWLGQKEAQQRKDDAARGAAAFLKNNKAGYAAGVRAGKIPANASPAFKESYKNAEGDYLGQKFSTDLELAYEQWPGKDSADPAAFDQWAQDYVKQALSSDDGDVLRGALPGITAALERKRSQHAASLADKTYKQGLRAHIGAATSAVATASEDGLSRPEGTDYEAVWSDILKRREAAYASGIRHDDFDKEMVSALVSQAIETRDPSLLALLEKTLPGSKVAISADPAFREIVNGAEDKLMQVAISMEERGYKQAERQRKERLNEITASTLAQIAKDPRAVIPEDVLAEGSKLDPKFRLDILAAQKNFLDGLPEDQAVLNDVMMSVIEGGGEKAVIDALRNGYISSPQTFERMLNFAKQREGAKDSRLLNSEGANRIKSALKTATTEPDVLDPFGNRVNESFLAAAYDYETALLDWQARNPDASEMEKMEAINKIGKMVVDRVNQDRQYIDPTPGDNPFAAVAPQQPAAQDQQQGQPDPAAAAAAPAMVPDYTGVRDMLSAAQEAAQQVFGTGPQGGAQDASTPDMRTLPEGTRAALEQRAANLGIDPLVLWDRTWRKLDGPQRRLFDPSPQVQYVTGTNSSNALLDVIGMAEAPEGYDTVTGFATSQPDKPITAMTLGELAAYQQKIKAEGSSSTAVGRYQIMSYTLPDIIKGLGLTGSEVFTPELQDRMAMWLLERRGLQDFLSGKIDLNTFADNLAQEWAGLPLASGKSRYEGDGLNAATIDRASVLESLRLLSGQ